jgi:hypothetical protein
MPGDFVMGCRNPWRMNVDQTTGIVYWGDVGPDAGGEGRVARGMTKSIRLGASAITAGRISLSNFPMRV